MRLHLSWEFSPLLPPGPLIMARVWTGVLVCFLLLWSRQWTKATWEERVCLAYTSFSLSVTEGSQGRNPEAGTEADAMEKRCFYVAGLVYHCFSETQSDQLMLAWNLLYNLGWPRTCDDPPASASWILELQAWPPAHPATCLTVWFVFHT